MSRHQKSKRKISDPSIRPRILSALSDNRWDYRTIEGIAAELNIPKDQVAAFVTQDPAIRGFRAMGTVF